MTTYTAITNAEIDQDSPLTETLATKYRDNLLAVLEGDATAPAIAKTLYLISSTTISSSATWQATLDNSSYSGYFIRMQGVTPASSSAVLWMRTSTDGGSSFDSGASDYYNRTGSFGAALNLDASGAKVELSAGITVQTAPSRGLSGTVEILNAGNTSETSLITSGFFRTFSTLARSTVSGMSTRESQADVDAVQILFSGGDIAEGTIDLWGYG
jgi:hypothetical protein